MTIGPNAPTNSADRFVTTIVELEKRIADLERQAARETYFPVYADATARNIAIPSPRRGRAVVLASTGQLTWFNGTSWVVI